MLVIQLTNDFNTKISEIKNKINDHGHIKYIGLWDYRKYIEFLKKQLHLLKI